MNQNRSVAFLSFGSTWTVEGTKLDLVTWFLYFFSFKIRSLVLDQKKKKNFCQLLFFLTFLRYSSMDMETFPTSNVAVQTMIWSLLLQTAQKSLLSLLFMVNSLPFHYHIFLLVSFLVQVM